MPHGLAVGSFTAVAFFACGSYLFFTRNRTDEIFLKRNQIDRIEVTRDTLQDQLYQLISSLQLNPRKSLEIGPYGKTNGYGLVEYDFNRLSTDLIIEGYKSISKGSNINDSIEYISKGNRMQGLQMAIETLDQARNMDLE
ncbi:hypothetical protein FJZ18_03680 [Candidatus Pacearchaeota archaeon]|nr:hypothetical protein [Candidatus Pacearchaeota archaeon]